MYISLGLSWYILFLIYQSICFIIILIRTHLYDEWDSSLACSSLSYFCQVSVSGLCSFPEIIWEAVRTFLCFETIYVNCKILVFVSFKRTSVYFHRAVILSFWKVNQIIFLLNLKRLDFGINPQTLAIANKSLQDVAVPANLVNILSHRTLPGSLWKKLVRL